MATDTPQKALRFTLDLDGHDREDLADALQQLAIDLLTSKANTFRSVSSRGWAWTIEEQSNLTREEYEEALREWFKLPPNERAQERTPDLDALSQNAARQSPDGRSDG